MKIYSRGVFAATWPWLFVLLFAIVPLLSSNRYLLELAILFFVWSAVVTHWNLLIGHAGIFSLVQLAIFNLGGYFTGVIGTHLKIGPVYTLVPAGLFCAFAGFLRRIALPAPAGGVCSPFNPCSPLCRLPSHLYRFERVYRWRLWFVRIW